MLPADFQDLEPFLSEWGELDTQGQRYLRRQTLPMARLSAYYDAVAPRLQAIFEHLDSFPFARPLPEPEGRLLRLAMGMTEVAQAVEVFGQPGVPGAPENHSVTIQLVPPD